MPRPLRPALIEGTYHITARGVNGEPTFQDDEDRMRYLGLVEKHTADHVRVLAYVLMNNHTHLVLATTDASLSTLIQRIHGIYAARFNRKYQRTGHLFGGRFHSRFIEDDSDLLGVTRYVHRNPVRAQIVEAPQMYPWSSYRAYVGEAPDGFIDPVPVLQYFSADRATAANSYRAFVHERIDLRSLLRALKEGHGRTRDVILAMADLLNLSPTMVDLRMRGSSVRQLAIALVYLATGWKLGRIAADLGMQRSGVASAIANVRRHTRGLPEHAELSQLLDRLNGQNPQV